MAVAIYILTVSGPLVGSFVNKKVKCAFLVQVCFRRIAWSGEAIVYIHVLRNFIFEITSIKGYIIIFLFILVTVQLEVFCYHSSLQGCWAVLLILGTSLFASATEMCGKSTTISGKLCRVWRLPILAENQEILTVYYVMDPILLFRHYLHLYLTINYSFLTANSYQYICIYVW